MNKWIISLISWILVATTYAQQLDSLRHQRYVTRATTYGVGFTNVYDTYLSPVEYKGVEFRLMRESIRLTQLADGKLSLQSLFQVHVAYTKNDVETGSCLSGLVNWNYALHYQFRIGEHLKLLAGGAGEINGGFIYNMRNSNNPASAKAYLNLAASGMAIYNFRIKKYPMTLRYQCNLPLLGVMFSPDHHQSYYEIFTLGHANKVVRFTSLHNQPSLRQMVSLDFPIRDSKMRVSYVCDLQQSHLNGLRTHTYSHAFLIGFVKTYYLIRNKRPQPMPAY